MARNEEHEEVKHTPMGRKTVMLIIGVAVLISVGLTAGVVMYILNSHNVSVAEAGSTKKADEAKKKEPPTIYPLEPFIVNISDGQNIRYLKLKVELDVTAGEEAKAELDRYLAPLRDSILVLLTSKTLQDVQDLPGKNRLREEILATASKILPPGKIHRVYFTDFVVQ
jgi:flagellar FliL protein